MTLQTQTFVRKRFEVEAVRVTHENMAEVAAWCGGEIRHIEDPTNHEIKEIFIKVHVLHTLSESQTKAFIGHWVLKAGTGFKVYKHKAFKDNFIPVDETDAEPKEDVQNVFDNNPTFESIPDE